MAFERICCAILALSLLFAPVASAAVAGDAATQIRCDFPGELLEAGEMGIFDLAITNNRDTATLNLVATTFWDDDGWKIRFEDGDRDVYKILIPSGETRTVRLVVETPGHAPVGEYPIRIAAGDGRLWVYAKITETHVGEAGTVALTVVDKEGNVVKGASVEISEGERLVDEMLTTAEGKVSIDVPMGIYTARVAKPGYRAWEEDDVEVRIGQTTDLGIVPLDKEASYAEVTVKSPSRMAVVGGTPEYELVLRNIGKIDDTYALSVAGLPEMWYARYKEAADAVEEISEIFVPAGEEKTLYLELITPYSVEPGEYNLTAVIDSAARSYEENLTLRLRGTYDLNVYSRSYRYDLSRGETLSFDMTVANSGMGGSLTNVDVEVSAPEGWRATVEPSSIASIDPGERRAVSVTVVPPADIVAGEYKLVAKVKCDQAEEEDEFRIVVKEQSYVAVLGLLVLAGVAAGLWFMFRKYGRR